LSVAETELAAGLIRRLDDVIEQLPKEGYKASVAVGAVSSTRLLVESLVELARLAECVASAKGSCRESGETRFCDPGCARIYLERLGDQAIVFKSKSNAFSARLSGSDAEVRAKGVYARVQGQTLTVGIVGEGGYVEETVNLADADEVFRKSYTIKYVLKRVARPVRVAIGDLRACAARNAIVC